MAKDPRGSANPTAIEHERYGEGWDEDEEDGGGNEGPSFESSMRAKYPVQQNRELKPHWSSTFNDRRKGR